MRNFSKKIITSVLTLVLTVVALGTGVFAWFSMNTRTTATGLTGKAEAAEGGFYISLNGQDWVNTIDLGTELANGGFVGAAPYVFTDLTSTDGIDLYKIVYDANAAFDGGPETTGYVEFELYFLTGAVASHVYLTELSITSDETSWSAETAASGGGRTVAPGNLMEAQLAHALRVSINEVDWIDGASVYDGQFNAAPVVVYENPASNDNGLKFGNTIGFGAMNGNFAAQYYNAVHGGNILQNYSQDVTTRGDKVLHQNGEKILQTHLILLANQPGIQGDKDDSFTHGAKVIVRVWLEGWDAEAFNALFGGEATVEFSFEVKNA